MDEERLIGFRDPDGIRPLVLGDLDGHPVLASETCALDQIGAKFVREVEPGEVVRIDEAGLTSWFPAEPQRRALCLFEYTYFARLDSRMRGELLYQSRMNLGAELARQHSVEADVVIGVPDSATAAAIAFRCVSERVKRAITNPRSRRRRRTTRRRPRSRRLHRTHHHQRTGNHSPFSLHHGIFHPS